MKNLRPFVLLAILSYAFGLLIQIMNNMYCNILFLKVYLFNFLAAVGFCCCMQAFSSCSEQGLLFIAMQGFLTVGASLVVEHRL